jgi:hypothetical protein
MALLVRKVAELADVNTLLRGGVIAGNDLRAGAYGLDGKTLITSSPAAMVTFDTNPEGAQQPLTLKAIIDQINAVAGLVGYAKAYEGRLKLEHPSGTTKVTLGNGTANVLLGFKNGETGTIYAAPGGSAPALVSVDSMQSTSGGYLVVTNEA